MTSTSPAPLWTTWGKGFTRRCSPVALRAPSAQRRRPASYTTSRDAPVFVSADVFAAEPVPFNKAAFEAAQKAGKPILVEVTAPWCPSCKAQAPILGELRNQPRFNKLVTFNIDFDSEKQLLTQFKVQRQSTLIVFKGTKEVGRSTGQTQREPIEDLLSKAL
jgi:thioredoxin 1